MKHELKALYTFENKIYTPDALIQKLGKDITKMRYRERLELGCRHFHRVCDYKAPHKATFKYYTVEGEKTAWQFGETAYFDTEAERDEARENYKVMREASKHRTQLLNKLAELDTETLEKIVNGL